MTEALPTGATVNIELEQGVLGCLMLHNAAITPVAAVLQPGHFADELHRQIFALMVRMAGEGQNASPVTLRTYLSEFDMDDGAGGGPTVSQYLAHLCAMASPPATVGDHARFILDLAARRALAGLAQGAAATASAASLDLPTTALIDQTVEHLTGLREELAALDVPEETNEQTLDELIGDSAAALDGQPRPVIATGLVDLDRRLGGGFRHGRLYVFAGRPGMGKTALTSNLAYRMAKRGHGVGIWSLEIDRKETWSRVAAAAMAGPGVSTAYSAINNGMLDPEQLDRLRRFKPRLAALPLHVDQTSGLSMPQIEARAARTARQMQRRGGRLDVVIIDYLQLLGLSDRYRGNPVAELGEAVLHAKNLSKRLDVAVLLLSQLNRGVESRDNKRPLMSDLRGSGNIEEHADAVGLLYRPHYYDVNDPKYEIDTEFTATAEARRNDLEIGFEKNRLGGVGKVTLYADVACCDVSDKSSFGRGY